MPEQSFMKSLFHGVIAEELVSPWPEPQPEGRDAIERIVGAVRRFGERVDSAAIDREGRIAEDDLRTLREIGVFGATVPREHGGLGLGRAGAARVIQELATVDSSIALTVAAHQSIGLDALLFFGTDTQKRKYLPRLAAGEWLAGFALTEATAGTDAAAIQTRAERSPEGEGWIVDGSKLWVTNGATADVFTVFARTSPAEEGVKPRITAFLVERGHGVISSEPWPTLGVRGSATTSVRLEAARVPSGNVLGEVGRGFKVATQVLDGGRVALAAQCVGLCKRLVSMSVARAAERRAFGRAIGGFGLIKDKIARMMVDTFALESALYATAGLIDGGTAEWSIESAICKVLGSETAWRVANEAAQIAGGLGYMADHPWERLLRDARVHMVFEGTNETLRCFVALAGMQGPGREITDVTRAMREPIKGFGLLSDFALRKARSALGRERLHRVHPLLNKETVLFEEATVELARNVEKVLRKHGKEIAEMQFTQRRVADLAIDLYALAACLSRTSRAIEKKGEDGARREIELTTAFAGHASDRIAANVRAFERNDDELLKAIAQRSYADGGYPFEAP
ncbi:MAG: acyl-CoA dehydrogenase family protein [Deltaproteobacteria bacterium]|nr:acyl-CoA dehydrogenase family protein [Deltaproteobacteria bacterium]